MQHYLRQQKGDAIVTVIVIVVVLMVVSLAVISLVRQQTKLASVERHRSQAFSVAEAGLEKALWLVEREQIAEAEFEDDNQYTFTGYNSQGEYSVTLTRDQYNEFHYEAVSTGKYTSVTPNQVKKVAQDLYYLNMSKSVFAYGSVNGGGSVTGNVKIWGPFYCGGDFTIGGTTEVKNQDGTTGSPLLVRGNLNIQSGSAEIGGDTQALGPESPMAVFVKGSITEPDQVFTLVSREVPNITLPPVTPSRYLDAAEANDFAVYNGNINLANSNIQFGQRGDGSYTFDYNGATHRLTVEGVVYIDGTLTISNAITYYHPSGFTQATLYVNKQITINDDILSGGTYPLESVLAIVNPDVSGVAEDITIQFSSNPRVYGMLYSGGTIKIYRQINVYGTVMANMIIFEQVPSIFVPMDIGNNYPQLYPGKDIAFVATSKWREVP